MAEEPGSAVIAAAKLHGSAHVHAIRYGYRGTPAYRKAYSQHIGRFLSAVREAGRGVRKDASDELRDAHGRWARMMEAAGAKLHGTTGITGLSRDRVVAKVRDILDSSTGHTPGESRAASYTAALAGKVAATVVPGLPGDVASSTEQHVAQATGYVIHKVLAHPGWRRLAASSVLRLRKSLDGEEADRLKEMVASTIADTRLHPRIAYDDAALAAVARGAHQHLHDRLCALKGQI